MTTERAADALVRWMIRRDMPEILEIERKSFEFPWTEENFLCCFRQRNCIGMVAERNDRIVGFMIYELLQSQLHVMSFCVAPWARRQGVGSRMVEKLTRKLSQQRRQEISLEIRETNLSGQLFFRNQGFAANAVIRDHYQDTDEDAYVMKFQLRQTECEDEGIRGSLGRRNLGKFIE